MPIPRPVLVLFAALCGTAFPLSAQQASPTPAVYFSPYGGCTQAVVAALDAANESVYLQAYGFTSPEIAGALARARRRGVRVEVILDKSNRAQRRGALTLLTEAGVAVWIDACHAIAHNKVILIDRATVITGSFNFTQAAESRNAENLLILRDPALAARYLANWEEHRRHSEPCGPGAVPGGH